MRFGDIEEYPVGKARHLPHLDELFAYEDSPCRAVFFQVGFHPTNYDVSHGFINKKACYKNLVVLESSVVFLSIFSYFFSISLQNLFFFASPCNNFIYDWQTPFRQVHRT